MSEFIEQLRNRPTIEKVLIAIGVGIVVVIPAIIILSAVIGAFVLGMGDTVPAEPRVSFEWEHDETTNELDVTHMGEEPLPPDSVLLQTGDNTKEWGTSEEVSTGDSITIKNVSSGDTVEIVWTGGEENTILDRHTVE